MKIRAKNRATVFHFRRINKNSFLAVSVKNFENSVSFSADKKERFSIGFFGLKIENSVFVSGEKRKRKNKKEGERLTMHSCLWRLCAATNSYAGRCCATSLRSVAQQQRALAQNFTLTTRLPIRKSCASARCWQ